MEELERHTNLGTIGIVVVIAVGSLRVDVVGSIHIILHLSPPFRGHPNIPRTPISDPLQYTPFNTLHILRQLFEKNVRFRTLQLHLWQSQFSEWRSLKNCRFSEDCRKGVHVCVCVCEEGGRE